MFENPEVLFGGPGEMYSLIGMIYEAVEHPELWPVVLDRVGAVTESGCTVLLTSFESPKAADVTSFARSDAGFLQKYGEYYASVNPLTALCDRMFADGEVRYSHQAVPDGEFERTEILNDFFKPNGYHYSFGIKIPLAVHGSAYLTTLRPKSAGHYDDLDGLKLKTLFPHLQRALGLYVRLSQLDTSVAGLQSAFDAFDQAVFGVRADGSVLFMNSSATGLVSKGQTIYMKGNRLHMRSAGDEQNFQKLLMQSSDRGLFAVSGGGAMLAHAADNQALQVVMMPYFANAGCASQTLASLVFVNNPLQQNATRVDLLRMLYKLTPTEARIAESIARGMEITAIAAMMGSKAETVRVHVKKVFQKTGVNRQVDLVRLVLALPGDMTTGEP